MHNDENEKVPVFCPVIHLFFIFNYYDAGKRKGTGGSAVPSERRPYEEQGMSEVLRSVSEKDGASDAGGGRPDYYEAWHEPVKTYDELESSLHSPNYHSAVRGMGSGTAVPKKKTAKKAGSGIAKVLRTVLLVAVCCAAGALCGTTAAKISAMPIP